MNPRILRLHKIFIKQRNKFKIVPTEVGYIEEQLEDLFEEVRYASSRLLSLGPNEYECELRELEEHYDTIERQLYSTLIVGLEILSEL